MRMKRASRIKHFRQTLKHQMKEYIQNSTLHGIQYTADGNLHFVERLAWVLFCCIGTVSAAVIIALLWEKFQTNPTITGLDTDFHDWTVPFPAITLCASNPHNDTYIDDFLRDNNMYPTNTSEEDSQCHSNITNKEERSTNIDSIIKKGCLPEVLIKLAGISYNNIDAFNGNAFEDLPFQDKLRSISMEVSAHCEDLFKDCSWKGQRMDSCCSPENLIGLRPIFTDHGLCYSFNSEKTERTWPWLFESLKATDVLEIYETDDNWDFSFNLKDTKHFPVKVFIHNVKEVPAAEYQPQHEWDGRVNLLVFTEKATYTTDDARQLSISQRHCIFPDEKELKLDPEGYTHSSCLRECHADEAMKICGCIPPFVNEIGDYKHCDVVGLSCLAQHKGQIVNSKPCTCELSCMNTIYEVEKLTEGSCKEKECEPLHIGFVSWPMVRYKREVLFGWVDLLVSFGGIAGLFLGFSLLSGVEIIYYFTLRALCMTFSVPKKLKKRNKKSNKKDININKIKKAPWKYDEWGSYM